MSTDLVAGVREIDEAHGDYCEAEEYYSGNVPEVFASSRIRRAIARTGVRYKFALASTPVRVLADRVALTGVSVDNDETANQLIDQVRRDNLLAVVEPALHLATFKFGDAYLFSWPVLDPGDQVTGVKVTYNGPECVRAIYDEDDPQALLYVIKCWTEHHGDVKTRRADLYYDATTDADGMAHPARIERYVTKPGTSGKCHQVDDWEPYLDEDQGEDEWLIEHDYGMPWTHFRNGLPYGTPEHAPAYGPQDAITKMLVTQITTTDSHGFPQRYGLVDSNAVLDESRDDPDWDDDLDADDNGRGGVSSGQRSGPGTMQEFTGMREVGQFAAADPAVFLTPVDVYVRLMSQVTGTPLWDFDPSKEQPSGIARKRAEAPLISKIGNREAYLTASWRAFWVRVLALLGHEVTDITISWAPAYTVDDAEGWQVLDAKRQMGVPVPQLLVEAGYTTTQAEEWAKAAPTVTEQQ